MMLNTFIKRWEHWWLRDAPPHALAFVRIALGIYLLIAFGLKLPFAAMEFSSAGLIVPIDAPWFPDALRFLMIPPSPMVASLLLSLFLVATLSFTAGYRMRISIIVMLLLYGWMYVIDLHNYWVTYEKLATLVLGILLFSGADRAFSVAMYRAHGSWTAWEPACILPQRLIALQITCTYLGVGWQKIWLPSWQNGDILIYSFIGRWGSPPAYWFVKMGTPYWVFDAMNFIVKVFEVTLPFGLWIPSVRKWYMAGGAFFHTFIAVFLQIWQFLVLVPCYVLFYEPEAMKPWLERMARGAKRGLSSMGLPCLR